MNARTLRLPFKDEADAIRIANSAEYHVVAGVWTRNGGWGHGCEKGFASLHEFSRTKTIVQNYG